MYGFTFGSRFCISASLQVNSAGIYSVMLLTSTYIFLRFLLYCMPHLIYLISLFISLITLWSHLFGTAPERGTQYSCLGSCTICSFQRRASGRGLQRTTRLLSCAASCCSCTTDKWAVSFASQFLLCLLTCYSSSLPFIPVLYRHLRPTKNVIRWELMFFATPSREKRNPFTRARRARASTQDQGCTH